MKEIIIYFSRAGENYNVGDTEIGNTEVIANYIKELTGADMFKIEPINEYPRNYDECIRVTKEELDRGLRPGVKRYLDNFDEYDTIYLGYPIWWGKVPLCVDNFIAHYNFSGKTVKPFCTHEGNGLGTTVHELRKMMHGADIKDGFEVEGSKVKNAKALVEEWLKK